MKQVSLASIEKAIDIVDNLDDDQLEATFESWYSVWHMEPCLVLSRVGGASLWPVPCAVCTSLLQRAELQPT